MINNVAAALSLSFFVHTCDFVALRNKLQQQQLLQQQNRWKGVKRWTRRVDLFSYGLVRKPQANTHSLSHTRPRPLDKSFACPAMQVVTPSNSLPAFTTTTKDPTRTTSFLRSCLSRVTMLLLLFLGHSKILAATVSCRGKH